MAAGFNLSPMDKKSSLKQLINREEILRYASSDLKDFWGQKVTEVNYIIDQVVGEVLNIDKAAKKPSLPESQSEAKSYKAIWLVSGSGTYNVPITSEPGDLFYKEKKWAHGSDRERTDYAMEIIKKVSLVISGKDKVGTDEQAKDIIKQYGPFLIYNGTPIQNIDLKSALNSKQLEFPEEKLFIPDGVISRTLDQVTKLDFPNPDFKKGDIIGIITHSPHYPRLLRMIQKYKPFPKEAKVQLFPVGFSKIQDEAEFLTGEIKGILGYISRGDADQNPYPYVI